MFCISKYFLETDAGVGPLGDVSIRPYHHRARSNRKKICRAEGPFSLGGDGFLLNGGGAQDPRRDLSAYPKPGRMD